MPCRSWKHPLYKLQSLALLLCLCGYSTPPAAGQPARASATSKSNYVGNAACAKCHAEIYASYERTAMAHASGPAIDAATPADFTHQASGVHYRIYVENARVWLSFDRPGDPEMRGKRQLLYFIGSGRRGRTYLFQNDGFLFESPVNWYANQQMWDTAPAYQAAREAPLDLPAYTSCLHCHVSGMQPPVPGTENRYPEPVFTQNGVGCERCHGPGAAHLAGGSIINPAKLPPPRRDEVCMQCHLEGKVAIETAGHHVYEYRPGEALSDYIHYFELIGPQGTALGATSQVEAFAQSRCKKKSGAAMSCTTCHDPHYTPSAEQSVSYFRGKCLTCHGSAFGEKHHPNHPDCTSCHMPASASADVAHTQVTDHRIPRRPEVSPPSQQVPTTSASLPRLVIFSSDSHHVANARDIALAWTSLMESGMTAAESVSRSRLSKALKQFPADPEVLSALGYLEQTSGATGQASQLYRRALAIDPDLIDAETNLGVIDARGGKLDDALRLWQSAFRHAPGRSAIGLNIAHTLCAEGRTAEAEDFVLRVLEFNPDMESAKAVLQHLNRVPPRCD